MLTNEKAEELLKMPKWVVGENGRGAMPLSHCGVPALSLRWELALVSEDKSNEFVLNAQRTPKQALKLSLHHRSVSADAGLLRVDYGAGHRNPPPPNFSREDLPARFHPYINRRFARNEPHIHYYVNGFSPVDLPWALPLGDCEFPVKEIRAEGDIWKAVLAFSSAIALKTNLRLEAHP